MERVCRSPKRCEGVPNSGQGLTEGEFSEDHGRARGFNMGHKRQYPVKSNTTVVVNNLYPRIVTAPCKLTSFTSGKRYGKISNSELSYNGKAWKDASQWSRHRRCDLIADFGATISNMHRARGTESDRCDPSQSLLFTSECHEEKGPTCHKRARS